MWDVGVEGRISREGGGEFCHTLKFTKENTIPHVVNYIDICINI
jgi:hypothetical protein